MEPPLISVVMANYNTDEGYLRCCIESILHQTHQHFEFIIIDDCSVNNSLKVIQSYVDSRIILLKNDSNHGISYSVNRGLATAKGKYIARMDSDDIAHPRRLELQVAFLESHPNIAAIAARAQNFGDRKGLFACMETDPEKIKLALFFACAINNPSTMFRKTVVEEHHIVYNEEFSNGEDYLFWTNLVRVGSIYEYPKILMFYRRHSRQISIYDRLRQIEMANKVRAQWLNELGITPTVAELWMHYQLCVGSFRTVELPAEYHFSLEDLAQWCKRLREQNEKAKLFINKLFVRTIAQRFMLIVIKAVRAKEARIAQALRLSFVRQYIDLSILPLMIKYAIFSLRVNQKLVRPRRPPVYNRIGQQRRKNPSCTSM
ncbi:MAG: glycosyltransferase [Bacillota bacterium]